MKKFTILIAAIALVCFAVPAMAVDWNFYGNARMATFWTSEDFGDQTNAAKTDSKDSQLNWDLQGNSRFGATIKAENISARIEMGINESSVSSRRVYGEWNFGSGKLKVGKDYSPTSQFISGQVFDGDLGLLGIGTAYSSRNGQVSFSFGGFEIALVTPKTGLIAGMKDKTTYAGSANFQANQTGTAALSPKTTAVISNVTYVVPDSPTGTATFKGDVDEVLPKIEAGWGMSYDAWNFNLMGGFQYYSIEDVTSFKEAGKTNDVDVTSWIIGGDVGFNFGPGYVRGALSYGSNTGNAGWSIPTGVAGRDNSDSAVPNAFQGGFAVWDQDDDTNDTTTTQAALVGGLKVSDMLSFEGGFGYRQDMTDGGSQRDTKPWAAYVQSVIALAPGVYVIPEVGYFDFDNNSSSADAGSLFYIGGKWQINF